MQFEQFKPFVPELLEDYATGLQPNGGSDERRLDLCNTRRNTNFLGKAVARGGYGMTRLTRAQIISAYLHARRSNPRESPKNKSNVKVQRPESNVQHSYRNAAALAAVA